MNDDVFVTPDGKTYDLTVPNTAEGRVHEIAFVTRPKAPELLACFSKACFVLGRHLPEVYLGHLLAGQETARRKAVVIIDVIPGILAEKKLASNAETRAALLDADPEYNAAVEKELRFEAAVMYFRLKIKDMDAALNALKKVVSETDGMYNRPNYNAQNTNMDTDLEVALTKKTPEAWPAGEWDLNEPSPVAPNAAPQPTTTTAGFKFGKPRY
jgi:hypothetical protein